MVEILKGVDVHEFEKRNVAFAGEKWGECRQFSQEKNNENTLSCENGTRTGVSGTAAV